MDQFFSNIQSIISQDLEIISASSFKRQSKTTAPQEPLQKERKFFLFNTNACNLRHFSVIFVLPKNYYNLN